MTTGPARPELHQLAPGLYFVATPIGAARDITLRALDILASADVLAAEDTRTLRHLMEIHGIALGARPLLAYHEHNNAAALPRLLRALGEGKSLAYASEAGTPLVSDPGYRLVEKAREAGIRVVPVPGPSAVLAALTGSGLPSDAFLFAGFLPVKNGARRARLEELKAAPATLIFFESPRRLADTLATMSDVLGDRPAAIGRELTKTFEEFRTERLAALAAHYAAADTPKGEVVICVGPPVPGGADEHDIDRLLLSLAAEMPASKAAGEAARMTGAKKPDLYRRLLELREEKG